MSAELWAPESIHHPHDFEVGQIKSVQEVNPLDHKLQGDIQPAKVVQVEIADPNINYLNEIKPGRVQEIQGQERKMDFFSRARLAFWLRKDTAEVAYDQDNLRLNADESTAHNDKVSTDRFFGRGGLLGDPALQLWRELIPQATALTPLSNPYNLTEIREPRPNGRFALMTDKSREWMTACTDGWEIRNRTAIMVEEIGAHLGKYAAVHPDQKMTVVSVAGGTALSTMQAIMRSGVNPANVELMLLESNLDSAQMAIDLATRIGYTGQITHKRIDIFNPTAMKEVKRGLDEQNAKVVAVDAVGIAEYTTEKLRTPAMERRKGADYLLFNPSKFIEACVDFADVEGIAVIGQMRADRPNPHFTRGVVGWPYVCMRSVENFAKILKGGRVNLGISKLSLTPLGVYTMATIYKTPEAAYAAGLIEDLPATRRSWMSRSQYTGSLAAGSEIV